MNALLEESRRHLGDLIEACQRCAWHLNATAARVEWLLTAPKLSERDKSDKSGTGADFACIPA